MKRVAVVGIAAGAAVVVAIGAAWWLASRPQGPESVAQAYVDALAGGDYAAIAALRADALDADSSRLVEDAFAGASARITEPDVVEVTPQGAGRAAARVEALLGGEPRELTFTLREVDGRWLLDGDELGALRVETTLGDAVEVGGAPAPAEVDLLLLPAVYPVSPSPRGLLEGSATATVATDRPTDVSLEPTLSPDAADAAQEQLDGYADACAEAADAVPANCGLRVPWAADLATLDAIAFRIEEYPAAALSDDASTFSAIDGVIVATAAGTTRDGRPAEFTYRADDWALRGSIRFEGDEMVLAVR